MHISIHYYLNFEIRHQYKLHSIKLDLDVTDALEAYCEETGMTKTAVIEKGIMLYIDSKNSIQEKLQKVTECEKKFHELLERVNSVIWEASDEN